MTFKPPPLTRKVEMTETREEQRVEEEAVSIVLHPDRIDAENIGEFYPEAISNATAVMRQLATDGSREQRDAGILAACAVAVALQTLVRHATEAD